MIETSDTSPNEEPHGRRVPVISVHSGDAETDEALRTHVYVREIARQCHIAVEALQRLIVNGVATRNSQDPAVFADVQSALFSTIVVSRILWPGERGGNARKKALSELAAKRGSELVAGFKLADDSPLRTVHDVRDSFEHIDERIDAVLFDGAHSLADWYIAETFMITTPTGPYAGEPGGVGLRVLVPHMGLLYFDQHVIDLFALDLALRDLRFRAEGSGVDATGHRMLFGGNQIAMLDENEAQRRWNSWRLARTSIGQPTPVGALEYVRNSPLK